MQRVLPSQAYTLKIAPHPAPFSILKFKGLDHVSELYCYDITFTSPVAGIPIDQVLPLLPQSVCVPCLLAEYSLGALLGTK